MGFFIENAEFTPLESRFSFMSYQKKKYLYIDTFDLIKSISQPNMALLSESVTQAKVQAPVEEVL